MKSQLTLIDIAGAYDALISKLSLKEFNRNKLWIVGVPRGGLILAQFLAYYYGVPKERLLFGNGASILEQIPQNDQIIVCDDIYDSGKQHKHFETKREITFAVLYARFRENFPKDVEYGISIEHDKYVYFPWDN
jgi:hypoxanthine phosphoribosyltransferase